MLLDRYVLNNAHIKDVLINSVRTGIEFWNSSYGSRRNTFDELYFTLFDNHLVNSSATFLSVEI